MYTGPKSRQVRAGREHQHVGVPNGDDSPLAATAEQHPDYQGKRDHPASPRQEGLQSVPPPRWQAPHQGSICTLVMEEPGLPWSVALY